MKRVIVIGASSGLGMEIARIYASRGDMVGVAARRLDRLDALASDFPANIVTASIDVTATDATDRLLNLVKRLGGTDLIINAAGIGYMNPSLEQSRDMATVATNCLGFTAIADTAFNYFAARPEGGQFAVITSVAASRGLALGASYSASKRFQAEYLNALQQLRHEKRLPIRLTDIRPGFVATDLLDSRRHYPMLMSSQKAAAKIVKAIDRRRRVAVVDWRWSILVGLWRLIPNWLWVRLPIKIAL